MKKFIGLIFTVLICVHVNWAFADSRAFLDGATIDSPGRTLNLSGWAAPEDGQGGGLSLRVYIGNKEVYSGPATHVPRPDVAKASNRSEWAHSGWNVSFPLPSNVPAGRQTLRVDVRFGEWPAASCTPAKPENAFIEVPRGPAPHWLSRIGILLGLACVVVTFLFAPPLRNACETLSGVDLPAPAFAAGGLVFCFLLFVGVGVTGSSVPEAQTMLPIQGVDTSIISRSSRAIRSDEWLVVTPAAIGQVRHQPPFPIINRNMGPDGHNMLVIGMTSVPVLALPALARPATWGFFFLPLPQAMAWHWWLPVFGCVLAVWACFATLFPRQWRMTLALSLCFVMSPYVVAWSYWPAYITMFAATAFAATVALLRTRRVWLKGVLAALIAIAGSGFALTLYPAWQIPLAYLFGPLLIATVYRDRHMLRFSAGNLVTIVASLAVAGAILLVWWLEAKDAIHAMMNTVYPGQRSAIPGGWPDPWFLARGFTDFSTMYVDLTNISNSSEISSFVYFFIPALFGAFVHGVHRSRNNAILYVLIGFLAVALWYQFIGFPIEFAKLSLWGRTLPKRVDLPVGFASIALIGAAFSASVDATQWEPVQKRFRIGGSVAVAVIWTVAIGFSMKEMPPALAQQISSFHKVLVLLVALWCSYTLAARWIGSFLLVYLAALVLAVSPFNPWTLVRTTPTALTCKTGENRTLTLATHVPAMTMMASGCAALNGVSYYPQPSIWRALDPNGKQVETYNRYQHLIVNAEDLHGSPAPAISTPQADVVTVGVDSRAFDFRRLPIKYVVVPTGAMLHLNENPSLRHIAPVADGWERFQVAR
ncbi:hypothetical protein [Caballeronia sp. GAFFF3]|uniref:DUF7657 domain-containing protein n=1 Tax=Caballeronia sp. GAFFF3 TaxID=2921759 RepID=UPI002027D9D2|nr:hypothetical protein [Caballeronia sp. GAFFF3]